jgi:hypothetical protein
VVSGFARAHALEHLREQAARLAEVQRDEDVAQGASIVIGEIQVRPDQAVVVSVRPPTPPHRNALLTVRLWNIPQNGERWPTSHGINVSDAYLNEFAALLGDAIQLIADSTVRASWRRGGSAPRPDGEESKGPGAARSGGERR